MMIPKHCRSQAKVIVLQRLATEIVVIVELSEQASSDVFFTYELIDGTLQKELIILSQVNFQE